MKNTLPEKNKLFSFLNKFDAFTLLIIAFSTFIVYFNTIHSPFIFDDIANIQDNIFIRINDLSFNSLKKLMLSLNHQRPTAILSFALNYYCHYYNLPGYHIVNISIHIFNAFILYYIIKLTLFLAIKNKFLKLNKINFYIVALISTLLWVLNPIQIFSVTYIVQRMNSLAALFSLISLYLYIHARLTTQKQANYSFSFKSLTLFFASFLAAILAITSKQNAIILPLLLAIYELHFFSKGIKAFLKKITATKIKTFITLTVILFSLLLFCLIFYFNTNGVPTLFLKNLYKNRPFTLPERLYTQTRLIIYYISLIFYPNPSRMSLLVEIKKSTSLFQPISTLFSIILIFSILLTAAIAYIRKKRILSFAIFWFFAAHLIESTFLPLELAYIHRNYLPSFFAFLPMLTFLFASSKNKSIRKLNKKHFFILVCLTLLIMIYAYWTYSYNEVWKSKVTFWKDNVNKAPNLERVYINYGSALAQANKNTQAIESYRKALKINRKNSITCYNIARLYDIKNNNDDALKYYSAALRRNKKFKDAWRDQGYLLFSLGNTEVGLNCIYKSWELDKLDPKTNAILGRALYRNGQIKGALFHLGQALKMQPYNIDANTTMALIAIDAKDYKTAEIFLNKVLKVEPSNSLALLNISFLHNQINKQSKGKK